MRCVMRALHQTLEKTGGAIAAIANGVAHFSCRNHIVGAAQVSVSSAPK